MHKTDRSDSRKSKLLRKAASFLPLAIPMVAYLVLAQALESKQQVITDKARDLVTRDATIARYLYSCHQFYPTQFEPPAAELETVFTSLRRLPCERLPVSEMLAGTIRATEQLVLECNCASAILILTAGGVLTLSYLLAAGLSSTMNNTTDSIASAMAIWNELPAPTILLDENLYLTYGNDSFLALTGLSQGELTNTSITHLLIDADGNNFLKHPQELREKSMVSEVTAILLSRSNTPHMVRIRMKQLPARISNAGIGADTGNRACYIATMQDLSAEYTVVAVRQQLSLVMGGLVKTLLANSKETLKELQATAANRLRQDDLRALSMAEQETARLQRLIMSLNEVCKIAHGNKIALNLTDCNPLQLMKSAAMAVSRQASTEKVSIDIACQFSEDDTTFQGDEDTLIQVLVNLLSNAIAHSPQESEISLRAKVANLTVRFEVDDGGTGIPADQRSMIFQRYQRGKEEARNPKGLGLGLALCKLIVESHGGTIAVEPSARGGSTFFFELPQRSSQGVLQTMR